MQKKETVNLKDKTVMVIDNGLFVELAVKLSKDFKRVLYYTHWRSAFPNSKSAIIGQGIKGVERVLSIFDYLDEVDLFVFPDIYEGDIQEHLVKLGKRVWGGRRGEELETERDATKKYMKSIGLPVNKYVIVKGIAKLREHLKKVEDKWIKISKFRGDFETWHHETYQLSEPQLDELQYRLGARAKITDFVVEDALNDKVEIGYDGYCIDGEFPKAGMAGIEVKDLGYIGIFKQYKDLPKEITDFNAKMKPCLKEYGYRGFLSTELRVGKDHVPYMIDFCARAGSPPSEVYQEVYTNLAEIIWNGANGIIIDPIAKGEWAVEVLIHSTWADQNWLCVHFPEKYRDNLKFRNLTIIEGEYYIVPQEVGLPEIGAIVVVADSLEKAIKEIETIACEVKGYRMDIPIAALDTAKEEMEKCKKYGIKLF